MSFRSRSSSRPVAPPRRRSSSLTRSSGSSNGYQTPSNGYQSSSNGRPFSVHGSALGSYPSSHLYGSNQNLRSSGGDYHSNPSSADYRRSAYGASNGTLNSRSTGGSSYSSPYKDRYTQNYGSNGASGYSSAYKDRNYYNPYTSYDNGVTTASLSIPMGNRDYSRSSNMLSSLSGSNSNLNQSINDKVANIGRSQSLREHERKNRSRKCKEAAKAAVPDTTVPYDASGLGGTLSSANKSLSSLSLQSEGYEVILIVTVLIRLFPWSQWEINIFLEILFFSFQSGNESRSRAESLASNALGDANDDGEFIDYKALYEAAK